MENGNGKVTLVPGDDSIILGATTTTIYPTAHPTTHTIYPTAHLITQTAHFLTWTGDGTGDGDRDGNRANCSHTI